MAKDKPRFSDKDGNPIGDNCPNCGANIWTPTIIPEKNKPAKKAEKCSNCGYVDSGSVKA